MASVPPPPGYAIACVVSFDFSWHRRQIEASRDRRLLVSHPSRFHLCSLQDLQTPITPPSSPLLTFVFHLSLILAIFCTRKAKSIECFTEKSSWWRNEQVCQWGEVKSALSGPNVREGRPTSPGNEKVSKASLNETEILIISMQNSGPCPTPILVNVIVLIHQ